MLVATLYNPHEQSKTELIENFIVRLNVFNRLFREIKASTMQYPEQHYLIEGQRGMGKTTLLLRLSYEVENDEELNPWLVPIVLKEEAYNHITRLFNLWEEVAKQLESKEEECVGLYAQMEKSYDETCDYERLCFQLLINCLEQCSKKILLFVDNLAEMFKGFDEYDSLANHRLREVLMTCSSIRVIGASTIVLETFFSYEHAFYEFFKKETLLGLDEQETHQLLLQLAKLHQRESTIQTIIETQPGRIQTLRLLTGGVTRTIILLFEIFIDHHRGDSMTDLEQILDRVTPLYKHRMDDLTPLQRSIIHVIALNWDALSSEEIVRQIRLKTHEVMDILNELDKVALLQRVATNTQSSLYYLRERFFNIWYLMRNAPKGSRAKVIWLVRFLEAWYSPNELVQRAKQHIQILTEGSYHPKAAYYLTEALVRTKLESKIEHDLIVATRKYLEEKDRGLAADLSKSDQELLEEASKEYKNHHYLKALKYLSLVKYPYAKTYKLMGRCFESLKEYAEAERYYLLAIDAGSVTAMRLLGNLYYFCLSDYGKAKKYYLMAYHIGDTHATPSLEHEEEHHLIDVAKKLKKITGMYKNNGCEEALKQLLHTESLQGDVYRLIAKCFESLGDDSQAEKYYHMAIDRGDTDAMHLLAKLYHFKLMEPTQAEKYYLMAVELGNVYAMRFLGNLYYSELMDYHKAEKYYLMAIGKKEDIEVVRSLGYLYHYKLKNYLKAEEFYLTRLQAVKDDVDTMCSLGFLYHAELNDELKAEHYYLMAIEKGDLRAISGLVWLYFEKKKHKHLALTYAQKILNKENQNSFSLEKKESYIFDIQTLACVYLWNNEPQQAIQIARDFMYEEQTYQHFEDGVVFYLKFLLAKQQYQYIASYFEDSKLDLKDKFKPLYYVFLYLTENPNYQKCPPELNEPVKDILDNIKELEIGYA